MKSKGLSIVHVNGYHVRPWKYYRFTPSLPHLPAPWCPYYPPITVDCVRVWASFLLRGVESPQALLPLVPAFPADRLLPVAAPLVTRAERARAGAIRVKLCLPLSPICPSQQILVLSPPVDLCLSTAHDPPRPARPIWLAVLAGTVFLQRFMLEH